MSSREVMSAVSARGLEIAARDMGKPAYSGQEFCLHVDEEGLVTGSIDRSLPPAVC